MNIFVKNFGTETSEQQLRDYFGKYGEIKNVKIMQTDKQDASGGKQSLGFGFICFTKPEDAQRAHSEA